MIHFCPRSISAMVWTSKTTEAATTDTVRKLYGRLSDDATFIINFGGEDYEVTLLQAATEDNVSESDLAADLNQAVRAATGDLVGAQVNVENGLRIDIYSLDDASSDFTLTADSSDPSVRELGLETDMSSADGVVTTVKDIPLIVGLLDGDVSFAVEVDGGDQ